MMVTAPKIEVRRIRNRRWLGYLFAAACFVWVFHDINLRQLFAAIKVEHWLWVMPAVFFDVLTYCLQGVRWSTLLKTIGRLRPVKATQAIYAGLFTNEIFPLRLGELLRAILVSRWLAAGISRVIPSLIAERFLDAFWLAVGIGIAAILLPLPKQLLTAGDILGSIVLLATALFVWITLRSEKRLEQGELQKGQESGVSARISLFLRSLADDLRQIGISRNLYLAVPLSAAMLVCQALAVWFTMLAYGLRLPVEVGVAVMLIVRLGTAIPNAPANVGTFQFFTVLALGLFAVDKTVAAGFSIVDFAVLTVPLWGLGLLALTRSGMSLASVRNEIAGRAANSGERLCG